MVTDSSTSSKTSFATDLRRRAWERGSWLCVGLDPDLERLPHFVPRTPQGVVDFCGAMVDATVDLVAAFKVNFAFFEALGSEGWRALERVRAMIPPDVPVIADAKRADIGNTSRAYATAIFDALGFDAVTVNPYLGWDSLAPFAEYDNKGVFVLCKTSNPGAADVQDLDVGGEPLYMRVARQALARPARADVGLVVGATQPAALRAVRDLDSDVLLLVPGVGAQGASIEEAVALGANARGENALITISREILYTSSGRNFSEAARDVAQERAAQTIVHHANR